MNHHGTSNGQLRVVKTDLHNHFKTDSIKEGDYIQFNTVIDRAHARLGPGAVVGLIDFHGETKYDGRFEAFCAKEGYDRETLGATGLYVPEKDILIVRGQEVPTKQGHLLVVNVDQKLRIKHNRRLRDTIAEIKDAMPYASIWVPHMYHKDGLAKHLESKEGKTNLEDIDGIEVFNGEAEWSFFGKYHQANKEATRFYRTFAIEYPHLVPLATSDGHSVPEIGSSWTEAYMPASYKCLRSEEEIGEALRAGLRAGINQIHPLKRHERSGSWRAKMHAGALAWCMLKERFPSITGDPC